MNIKGPIKIIVEGPVGSGKTQITDLIKAALFYHNVDWSHSVEGVEIKDNGQIVNIIEKNS